MGFQKGPGWRWASKRDPGGSGKGDHLGLLISRSDGGVRAVVGSCRTDYFDLPFGLEDLVLEPDVFNVSLLSDTFFIDSRKRKLSPLSSNISQ